MQAAYLDYAPTMRWHRNHSQQLHRRKLQEIKSASPKRIDQSEPVSRKLLPKIKRDVKEVQREKREEIEKENNLIFGRLSKVTKSPLFKNNSYAKKKKNPSLHSVYKKSMAERINQENELIVKRLSKIPSNFSHKALVQDYKKTLFLKNNASKKKWLCINTNDKLNKLEMKKHTRTKTHSVPGHFKTS